MAAHGIAGQVATVLQLLAAGTGTGSVYALVALGFNVVFKSTGAMNFAQGEWVMMGGMVTASLVAAVSSVGLACIIAVVIVGAIGLLSERLTVWPLRRPTPLLMTLVTIGLSICSRSLVMLVLGRAPAGYHGFAAAETWHLGGVLVPSQTAWVIGITLVFLALMHVFFERSLPGRAMRAAAADPEAAALVGVPVQATTLLAFGIAAVSGAIAGAIVTPLTLTSDDQGAMFGFKGFSAAMLGGIGSLPGAVFGGLLLGGLETFGSFYISSQFKDAIAFAVLLAVLFLRPAGLLGQAGIVKV